MRPSALAFLLALPAHAQDVPAARVPIDCPEALHAERASCIVALERGAAELRIAEQALRAVPEPPSRVAWMSIGLGAGVAIGLALALAGAVP